jgi:DNA-binding NtrC family response regulator
MVSDAARATVLFVDDDPSVTQAVVRVLRQEHFECVTANSAAGALEILQQRPVDVLVSDERMPATSGSELLAIVRERFPACVRIILSVYRFLQKPCNPAELAATIQQALQHKRLQDLSRELLRQHQRRGRLLQELEARNPGITQLATDDDGAILVDERDAAVSMGDLLREMEDAVAGKTGVAAQDR